MFSQHIDPWMLVVPLLYLIATLLLRLLGRHAPPAPQAGPQWLPSVGVDLLAVGVLQWLHTGSMNFTALLGLPILMTAVLGTLTLAWGTSAAATLLLLGWAWWLGEYGPGDPTQRYLQVISSWHFWCISSLPVWCASAKWRNTTGVPRRCSAK